MNEDWKKALLKEGFRNVLKPQEIESSEQKEDEKYDFLSLTTPLPGLVQWSKLNNNHDDNNNNQFNDDYLQFTDTLEAPTVIIVPTEDYCNRITASNDTIQFPVLSEYVNKIITRLQQTSNNNNNAHRKMKLIFAFLDLDKDILKVQRKFSKENNNTCVQEIADQSLIHLTFNHDIETFRCRTLSSLCEYLYNITKALSRVVNEDARSAFDFVMKVSKAKPDESMTPEEQETFELQQTWAAMLQMVPYVSKEKAFAMISNKEFSCPKRVFEAMNNTSEPEAKRIASLHRCFGKSKNGSIRNEVRLSKHVYRLMTVTNPEEQLEDEMTAATEKQ